MLEVLPVWFLPLIISIGVATLVCFAIITQIIYPCAIGTLPSDYCYGDNQNE